MEVVTASPSMLAWDSLWMQQRWRAARVAWYDHFFIIPHLQIVFLFKRVICSYQPTLTQVTSLQEIDQISQLWKVIVTTIIFFFSCKNHQENSRNMLLSQLKSFCRNSLLRKFAVLHLQHPRVMAFYPCGIQVPYYYWWILHCYIFLPGNFICHFQLQWPHFPSNTGWDLNL